jgi:isopenicillin-N epimerase
MNSFSFVPNSLNQVLDDWSIGYREPWDLDPNILYLNHGAFGLSPRIVLQDRDHWSLRCTSNPMDFYLRQLEPAWWAAREKLATFVGTKPENLAFCTCATTGMNHIASFFPLKPGEEVLLNQHEYGAVKKIWQRRCRQTGGSYREMDLSFPIASQDEIIDRYRKAISPQTRLLILSQITSPTAMILPIAELTELAHRSGAAVCVDGPHTILQLPLNIDQLKCDFYTASCHKWLSAPLGSGFTYIAPQWHSIAEPFEISWGRLPPGELRHWTDHQIWVGTRDYSPYLSVPTAIDFFSQFDATRLRNRNHQLADYVRQQLSERLGTTPVVPSTSANSLYGWMAAVWLPDRDWSSLQRELWDHYRIEVPIIFFQGRYLIRVSCHLYHGKAEMDQLIDAVVSLCNQSR